MYWDYPRKVLGTLVPDGAKVTGDNYHLYHDQKVIDLISKAEAPETLFENLLPIGCERVKEKNPEKLFDWLKGQGGPGWDGHRSFMSLHLRNEQSLKELKQSLPIDLNEREDPPNQRQFLNELKDLSLWEYLELTVSAII